VCVLSVWGADPRTASLLDWAPSPEPVAFIVVVWGADPRTAFCLDGHRPKERLLCVWCLFGEQTLGLQVGLYGHRPYERLCLACLGADPMTAILLDWAPSPVTAVFIVICMGEQTLGLHFGLNGHRPKERLLIVCVGFCCLFGVQTLGLHVGACGHRPKYRSLFSHRRLHLLGFACCPRFPGGPI